MEPVTGLESIRRFRKGGSQLKVTQLCNGPSRLCQAFDITTAVFNRHDLSLKRDMWLEDNTDPQQQITVVATKRVGIDSYGAEWAAKLWRYYALGNPFVSKRDKVLETTMTQTSSTVNAAGLAVTVRKRTKGIRRVKEL